MIDDFQKIIGYQSQAISILGNSKMPADQIEEFTKSASDLLVVGLNITSKAFQLNEDEQFALLTLVIVKSLKVTEND